VLYLADAPNITDWIQAWVTVGGAVLSGAAVLVAVLVVRQEQRHRREDRYDAERAQARLVHFRITGRTGDRRSGWTGVTYRLSNNSQSPVYEVVVAPRLQSGPGIRFPQFVRVLNGSDSHDGTIPFDLALDWPPHEDDGGSDWGSPPPVDVALSWGSQLTLVPTPSHCAAFWRTTSTSRMCGRCFTENASTLI
jgi:hypothetical protein